jgi:hypothetical protein
MTAAKTKTRIALDDWWAEGLRLFGTDTNAWSFVCPACGHIATVADWKAVGAPQGAIGFSCVGRWLPRARDAFGEGPGPCIYAGGGLFLLNPIIIVQGGDETTRFAFAPVGSAERVHEPSIEEVIDSVAGHIR